jgi:hypothetical protein
MARLTCRMGARISVSKFLPGAMRARCAAVGASMFTDRRVANCMARSIWSGLQPGIIFRWM